MTINLGARHAFLRKYGIPSGWQQHQLGNLAKIVGGGTPSRSESRFWNCGVIPWATPTDITENNSKYIQKTSEYITEAGLQSSAATLLPAGTILYTSRATLGAKSISTVPMATNQGFANFLPENVDVDYLYYLLDVLTPLIKRLSAGTTFDEVSKRDLRTVWCAVPKIREEQTSIAQILNAIDTSIERTRFAAEHAIFVKNALKQCLFTEGVLHEPQRKTSIGFLPQSWEVVPISSIVKNFQYGLSKAMQQKGEIPIIRMGNIQNGEILLNDLKYVTLPKKVIRPYLVNRGDVLFNRTNSQEHVGKVGIYRHERPIVFASYLIRLLPDTTKVDNYYLGQVLNSYTTQCRIKRYATPGVQQVNINAKNLGKVLIPLPVGEKGLEEQRKIGQILEGADALIRTFNPKIQALQILKNNLMHDLLTGHVRIKNIKVTPSS